MGLVAWVSNVVAFLRAGYPGGAPSVGYAPLLSLLPRRVSEDEIATIARKLFVPQRYSVDSVDVGVEITRITDELPSVNDVQRVQRRMGAMRWAGGHHP